MTKRLGVLTSGGDAPGMNARQAPWCVVGPRRRIYAIYEGYRGMIRRGRPDPADDVEFGRRHFAAGGNGDRHGSLSRFPDAGRRKQPCRNLLEREIDGLVVIGGDGSLTGANLLRQEWAELVAELVDEGAVSADLAERHRALSIAGLVGSIDNDMYGTDMTIGGTRPCTASPTPSTPSPAPRPAISALWWR